ncbi:MAG TPA: BMC domain-containing protein [Candidatus Krumholzibacteria bacterium]|nr:BMC domain-containing protein [Candidatus Krumholzibacteria bacterium]HPD71831.1 BMC domain-containing protein [Candidatus Krumholzibacteria bacterium]HRY41236.1 BMC domain-containing protein [Candidatus Krumholzibacteria bacterium]
MRQALALLEFSGAAAGILAADRLLKAAPIALLRCGTVHPGRYLVLVGGTVAATAEAHAAGLDAGGALGAVIDEVCLPDPHPQLAGALGGERLAPAGEALGVVEVGTSPGLLRAIDAALKAVPVDLVELRLADDLGGRALAVVSGRLTDVQEALDLARARRGERAEWLGGTVLPRLDDTLREALAESTRFGDCRARQPAGAETGEG